MMTSHQPFGQMRPQGGGGGVGGEGVQNGGGLERPKFLWSPEFSETATKSF